MIGSIDHLLSSKVKVSLFKQRLLDLLFPRVCPVCGEILTPPSKQDRSLRPLFLCPDCYPKLNPIKEPVCAKCSRPLSDPDDLYCDVCQSAPLHYDFGSALWIHDETAKKILYDLKFRNKRDNADLVGFEMALHAKEYMELWNAEALIPVPLHKKRMRERGFNQAQLIAEKFSYWIGVLYGIKIPVDHDYLLRRENTKPQRTLESSMRAQNVRTAFCVNRRERNGHSSYPADMADKNTIYRSVILIDDIFTSGSTINSCAKTLKAAGCKKVFFLTASIV